MIPTLFYFIFKVNVNMDFANAICDKFFIYTLKQFKAANSLKYNPIDFGIWAKKCLKNNSIS